jgi:hypothetical protein
MEVWGQGRCTARFEQAIRRENGMQPASDQEGQAVRPEPSMDAIIGHWFACGVVHIVFAEADGQQFYLLPGSLERSYGVFLDPGQTWGRRDPPMPIQGTARAQAMLRAFHEAGHAVACIDEGIKVEYITIVSHAGMSGEPRLGFCQYDYRVDTRLRAESVAKAQLAGPYADYMYRERNGIEIGDEIRNAWRYDRSKARRIIEEKARQEGGTVNSEQVVDGLFDIVAVRFKEPWVWIALSEIADRLCTEGAISGGVAREIFERAKDG